MASPSAFVVARYPVSQDVIAFGGGLLRKQCLLLLIDATTPFDDAWLRGTLSAGAYLRKPCVIWLCGSGDVVHWTRDILQNRVRRLCVVRVVRGPFVLEGADQLIAEDLHDYITKHEWAQMLLHLMKRKEQLFLLRSCETVPTSTAQELVAEEVGRLPKYIGNPFYTDTVGPPRIHVAPSVRPGDEALINALAKRGRLASEASAQECDICIALVDSRTVLAEMEKQSNQAQSLFPNDACESAGKTYYVLCLCLSEDAERRLDMHAWFRVHYPNFDVVPIPPDLVNVNWAQYVEAQVACAKLNAIDCREAAQRVNHVERVASTDTEEALDAQIVSALQQSK